MTTGVVAAWYKGTTRKVDTTITDKATGNPVDLTGATARFVLVRNSTSVALVTKTVGNGITLGGNGLVTVTVDPADTASLDAGDYLMQLEVTLAGGSVFVAYDVLVTLKANFAHV